MNLQLLIVIVIGIVTVIVIVRGIIRFFSGRRNSPPCGGCKSCHLGEINIDREKIDY